MIFLTLANGCRQNQDSQAVTKPARPAFEGTVVAVGDSLTAGYGVPESEAYPALMEKKLREAGYNWRVINAGVNGETTSGTVSRLDWILKLKPDVIVLEIGANDGLRGIDPDLVKKNIDKLVGTFQSRGIVVVLAGMQMLRNLGHTYTTQYAKLYPEIAAKRDVILIPFFLEKVAGEVSLNLSDGIHPTAEGYKIVTETVYPYVVKAIDKSRKKSN